MPSQPNDHPSGFTPVNERPGVAPMHLAGQSQSIGVVDVSIDVKPTPRPRTKSKAPRKE